MKRIEYLEKLAGAKGCSVADILMGERLQKLSQPVECECPECGSIVKKVKGKQCRAMECEKCGTPMRARISKEGFAPKRSKERDQKMTDQELEDSKRIAEKLKGVEGIDNPHALARWIVQQPKEKWEKYVETAVRRGKGRKKKKSSLDKLAYIRKTPGKREWCVISHRTGKSLGCYDSKEKAEKRLGQIHAFKRKKSQTSDVPTVPKPMTPCPAGMIWMWNPETGRWEMRPEVEQED